MGGHQGSQTLKQQDGEAVGNLGVSWIKPAETAPEASARLLRSVGGTRPCDEHCSDQENWKVY